MVKPTVLPSGPWRRWAKVDILVNNAGANRPQAIDAITDQVWDQIVELNLTSCMALSRALLPQMRERKWGRVIHISSIMGLGSKAERDSYSATKFALHGLAKASALDVRCRQHHRELHCARTLFNRYARPSPYRRTEADVCGRDCAGALGPTR